MSDSKIVHGLTVEEWRRNVDNYVKTEDLQIRVCRYCGAFFLEGKWINDGIDIIVKRILSHNIDKVLKVKYPFILSNYKIKSIEVNDKISVNLEITVGLGKEHFTTMRKVTLNILQSICPRCYARKIKAYDTIIQIRGQGKLSDNDRRRIYGVIKNLPESVKGEIIDIKATKDGIDVLLNDKGLGRYIARIFERELGADILESYKLISRKPDGKTKSKLSISVRIPPHSKFLIRNHKDHLLFVYGFSTNGFLAYDFDDEKHLIIPFKTFWQLKKKSVNIPWHTMRVIGIGRNKIILLDENDYITYEGKSILGEKFFKDEKVSVLEYKGKIYVIKTETLEGGLRDGEKKEEKKS